MSGTIYLRIESQGHTEQIVQSIVRDLGAENLDEIDVFREYEDDVPLAEEPVASAIVFAVSAGLFAAVVRSVEVWLDHSERKATLKMIVDCEDPKKLIALTKVAAKHADVFVEKARIRNKSLLKLKRGNER